LMGTTEYTKYTEEDWDGSCGALPGFGFHRKGAKAAKGREAGMMKRKVMKDSNIPAFSSLASWRWKSLLCVFRRDLHSSAFRFVRSMGWNHGIHEIHGKCLGWELIQDV